MRYRSRNRGSVIVLVVGLLTILAMLGSALLISAHVDSRQSRALAAKAQGDPIAEGVLLKVRGMIGDGGTGPTVDHPSSQKWLYADFSDSFAPTAVRRSQVLEGTDTNDPKRRC